MGRAARLVVAAALLLFTLAPADAAGAARPATPPSLPPLPALDPASLSPGGRAYLDSAAHTDAPRYALSAQIDPQTGDVEGRLRAQVPAPERGDLRFRMLAGLPALHTGLAVRDVTVDGKKARAQFDQACSRFPHRRSPPAR